MKETERVKLDFISQSNVISQKILLWSGIDQILLYTLGWTITVWFLMD